jgi:hypothetical protein
MILWLFCAFWVGLFFGFWLRDRLDKRYRNAPKDVGEIFRRHVAEYQEKNYDLDWDY